MKTILERAKEAVIDPFDPDEMLPVRMGYLSMLERRGFVAGAMSELNELLRWHKIQSDKSGFATDEALDEIFRELPRLVKDKRDGCIELIDYDNAAEWRGDLERKPSYSRNRTDDMRTKTLYKADGDRLKIDRFPCFHITGSIAGMKRMFYGKDALLVRCGSWIYNVSKEPRIYHIAH